MIGVLADRRVALHSIGASKVFEPGEEIPDEFQGSYTPRGEGVAEVVEVESGPVIPWDATTTKQLMAWIGEGLTEASRRNRAQQVYDVESAKSKPRKGVLEGATDVLNT